MTIAWFSEHVVGDGNGAWIDSTHIARLFACDQSDYGDYGTESRRAGESGYPDTHPLMVALKRSCGARAGS